MTSRSAVTGAWRRLPAMTESSGAAPRRTVLWRSSAGAACSVSISRYCMLHAANAAGTLLAAAGTAQASSHQPMLPTMLIASDYGV